MRLLRRGRGLLLFVQGRRRGFSETSRACPQRAFRPPSTSRPPASLEQPELHGERLLTSVVQYVEEYNTLAGWYVRTPANPTSRSLLQPLAFLLADAGK